MSNEFTQSERATMDRTRGPVRRRPRALATIPTEAASTRVRKAIAAAVDLMTRETSAVAALAEAEAALPVAQHADLEAEAASIRSGKATRTTAREDVAREALERTRRDRAAIGLAVDDSIGDLERIIAEDRAEWIAALEQKLGTDVERAAATVVTLEANLGAIAEDLAVRRWIASFPSSKSYRPDISIPVGEVHATDVVASLAAALEEVVRPERETLLRDRPNAELGVAEVAGT